MPKDEWPKLVILHTENQKYSPSNEGAITKFVESAQRHELNPIIIPDVSLDFFRLWAESGKICGLLIRDTTNPGNHTYEFSIVAQQYNLPVIDSHENIMRGCNKIWQCNQFLEHHINHPKTHLVSRATYQHLATRFNYPVVIKLSDSSFSQGVYLAKTQLEFGYYCTKLFDKLKSPCSSLIVQEFIKTEFDWRIGVFRKKLLFSCKYYMAEDGWKIIKYDPSAGLVEGRHQAIEGVCPELWEFVESCFPFLDDGLYGLDIKEKDGKYYMIEINDNPSIDSGVEDQIEGEKLYDTIIEYFVK